MRPPTRKAIEEMAEKNPRELIGWMMSGTLSVIKMGVACEDLGRSASNALKSDLRDPKDQAWHIDVPLFVLHWILCMHPEPFVRSAAAFGMWFNLKQGHVRKQLEGALKAEKDPEVIKTIEEVLDESRIENLGKPP